MNTKSNRPNWLGNYLYSNSGSVYPLHSLIILVLLSKLKLTLFWFSSAVIKPSPRSGSGL